MIITTTTWIILGIILLVFVGYCLIVRKCIPLLEFLTHPMVVFVRRQKQGSIQIIKDFGKIKKDKAGNKIIHLAKSQSTMEMPKTEYFSFAKGLIGVKDVLHVYNPSGHTFVPISFDMKNKEFPEEMGAESVAWKNLEMKKKKATYSSGWMSTLQMLMPVITLGVILVLFIITMKNLNTLIDLFKTGIPKAIDVVIHYNYSTLPPPI